MFTEIGEGVADMPEWFLAILAGGAIAVVGGTVNAVIQSRSKSKEMEETRKRDAVRATLDLIGMQAKMGRTDEWLLEKFEVFYDGLLEGKLGNKAKK